jgi:hypothetical protein
MDAEPQEPEPGADLEQDREAWTLPRAPLALAMPPHDNWPEREQPFEEGFAHLDGPPHAAA